MPKGVYQRHLQSVEARFWAKVQKTSTCWLWQGATSRGYGIFWDGKRLVRSHRYAYELLVGPIPAGLTIDHQCRVHNCVRPAHLEPVTRGENVLRGDGPTAWHARKIHCLRGHSLSGENLINRNNGGRDCRDCRRVAQRQRRAVAREDTVR